MAEPDVDDDDDASRQLDTSHGVTLHGVMGYSSIGGQKPAAEWHSAACVGSSPILLGIIHIHG
jgi:hypothetical protein